MRKSTGVKFSTMVSTKLNFIIMVQNFRGLQPKNFTGQKHAKFGLILVEFEVRQQIFPERIKIFKIGKLLVRHQFIPR